MWRLVKEGLRIYRPVLLSAWTTGTFGPLSVFVVLTHFGVKIDGWQALSWAAAALPAYLLGAYGNLAVCTAATSALAIVTAAFTVTLFRRRTLIGR